MSYFGQVSTGQYHPELKHGYKSFHQIEKENKVKADYIPLTKEERLLLRPIYKRLNNGGYYGNEITKDKLIENLQDYISDGIYDEYEGDSEKINKLRDQLSNIYTKLSGKNMEYQDDLIQTTQPLQNGTSQGLDIKGGQTSNVTDQPKSFTQKEVDFVEKNLNPLKLGGDLTLSDDPTTIAATKIARAANPLNFLYDFGNTISNAFKGIHL